MSALAQVHVVIMYTHKTTVLLWCSSLCDIRVLFLYNVCQYVWRIASIRFNNVSLCPLILIPNMSGLLCPLLLNPDSRFASWMRANHYTSHASRNECSNVGACSLHATQVPNACRKWHNIYISCSHSQSSVHVAYHSSMSCQCLKLSIYAYANRSLGSI